MSKSTKDLEQITVIEGELTGGETESLPAIEPSQGKKKRRFKWGKKRPRGQLSLEAMQLKLKGYSNSQIARRLECTPATVTHGLKKWKELLPEIEDVPEFRANQPEILSAAKMRILKSAISADKLAKATLNQSLYAYDILNKSERLERGQSTSNTQSLSITLAPSSNTKSSNDK